jgi:hypothetical protein
MVQYNNVIFNRHRRRRPAIRRFIDGATMDAAVAVGDVVELIGTTTRAVIARLECVTVAPVTYRLCGKAHWWRADGDEFTGVFKWVDQALATHTWGVAGSRATGGLINGGNGAQFLEGLVPLYGVQRCVSAWVRLVSLALTAANGAWIGTTRSADLATFSGCGLGVNATPAYACCAFLTQSLTTPTLTNNTSFVGAPSTANEQRMWAEFDATSATSLGQIARGGILEPGGQQQLGSTASSASAAGNTNDRIVAISGRNITFRVIDLEIVGQT